MSKYLVPPTMRIINVILYHMSKCLCINVHCIGTLSAGRYKITSENRNERFLRISVRFNL